MIAHFTPFSPNPTPSLRVLHVDKGPQYAAASLYLLREHYAESEVEVVHAGAYGDAKKSLSEARIDIVVAGAGFPGEPEFVGDNAFKRGGIQLLKHVAKVNDSMGTYNGIAFCFLTAACRSIFDGYLAKHGVRLPWSFPFYDKCTTLTRIVEDFERGGLVFPRRQDIAAAYDGAKVLSL